MTDKREELRGLTVDVIDHAARLAMKAGSMSPLKLWSQVQDRVVAATRTNTTAQGWANTLLRQLRVPTPDERASAAIRCLVEAIGPTARAHDRWLGLVEQEASYLMAVLRGRREKKREKKKAKDKPAPRPEPSPQGGLWSE